MPALVKWDQGADRFVGPKYPKGLTYEQLKRAVGAIGHGFHGIQYKIKEHLV